MGLWVCESSRYLFDRSKRLLNWIPRLPYQLIAWFRWTSIYPLEWRRARKPRYTRIVSVYACHFDPRTAITIVSLLWQMSLHKQQSDSREFVRCPEIAPPTHLSPWFPFRSQDGHAQQHLYCLLKAMNFLTILHRCQLSRCFKNLIYIKT